MLKIRLSRTGKKSQPSFRIIVQEHTSAIKGKFIELLGFYKPTTNPKEFKVDHDRVKYWLSVGAQPTDSMAVLLRKDGMEGMDQFIAPRDKQKKKKKEKEKEVKPTETTEAAAEPAPAPAPEPTPEPAPATEPTPPEPPATEEPAPEPAPKQ